MTPQREAALRKYEAFLRSVSGMTCRSILRLLIDRKRREALCSFEHGGAERGFVALNVERNATDLAKEIVAHGLERLAEIIRGSKPRDFTPCDADHEAERHKVGIGFHTRFSIARFPALDSISDDEIGVQS